LVLGLVLGCGVLPGCIIVGDSTVHVSNESSAADLIVRLEPGDEWSSYIVESNPLGWQESEALLAGVGAYDLVLVDEAGDSCLLHTFYLWPGDVDEYVITDHDLWYCVTATF